MLTLVILPAHLTLFYYAGDTATNATDIGGDTGGCGEFDGVFVDGAIGATGDNIGDANYDAIHTSSRRDEMLFQGYYW